MSDPRLLVPLSNVPGLNPVGLNVYLTGPNSCCGIFIDFRDSDECGIVECADDGVGVFPLSDVRLDLSDATTRDRCLRWLAEKVGLKVAGRCPWWWALGPVGGRLGGQHGWGLGYSTHSQYWSFGVGRITECPALNGLDSRNDTCLPDGFRLVDALALAAVVCHLGGLR